MTAALSPEQLDCFRQDGFLICREAVPSQLCAEIVTLMSRRHAGEDVPAWLRTHEHFRGWLEARDSRAYNWHCFDEASLRLALWPSLGRSLAQLYAQPADLVSTMFFFKPTGQGKHQDAFVIPGCIACWMACEDIGAEDGTLWAQKGSHAGRILRPENFEGKSREAGSGLFGPAYYAEIETVFDENARRGLEEVPIVLRRTDIVWLHGGLIHRGGKAKDPGKSRFVFSGHYVPRDSPLPVDNAGYSRISFDDARPWTPDRRLRVMGM